MSTLTDDQQDLLAVGQSTLPSWFVLDGDPAEALAQAAVAIGNVQEQVEGWLASSYILRATGFWLDQHARDRGTRRANGESDAALATRLRNPADQVTLPALYSLINTLLLAAGQTAPCHIVEMRTGCARVSTNGVNHRAFVNRGYRVAYAGTGNGANEIIVILPYGTPAGASVAVAELVRLNKAAGVHYQVETRNIP